MADSNITKEKCANYKDHAVSIFCKNDAQATICIFKVPNSITATKPEAYVPKRIGLGPYHHFRTELHQFQKSKLDAAREIYFQMSKLDAATKRRSSSTKDDAEEQPKDERFNSLVSYLKNEAPEIRSCYHMYLDMDDEVLACIMAIDGLALLALLCYFSKPNDDLKLVNSAVEKFAQDSALRDAMMLENQIPLSVVEKIYHQAGTHVHISSLILDCCLTICPLKGLSDDQMKRYPHTEIWKHSHLLGLLYHFIMLKELPVIYLMFKSAAIADQFVDCLIKMPLLPTQLRESMQLIQGIMNLPWSDVTTSISSALNQAPPEEESLIPRASKLSAVGVNFCLANHIENIKFDACTTSFCLPLIKVDAFSEVILRNLSAYEILTKSESEQLILTRYLELMKGIIVTPEDVKVLKDGEVLKSETLGDDEIANMFRGMVKSTRSTNTPALDKTIEEVNKYYYGLWKVKARKSIKNCLFVVWKFGSVAAIVLLLFLLTLQTFCSVYGCHGIFNKN